MLQSLTNVEAQLLVIIWGVTFSFFACAILCCVFVILKRALGNRRFKKRAFQKDYFVNYLTNLLDKEPDDLVVLRQLPNCNYDDIISIFLHFFQTLKGQKLDTLKNLIANKFFENKIIMRTFTGSRGHRMQAVKTLAYLESKPSLMAILECLDSQDKYIRLTSARSLVRRQALSLLPQIIAKCLKQLPHDYKLVGDILSGYGEAAVKPLEKIIQTTEDDMTIAACLEALIIIMPPKTNLDFSKLMKSKTAAVRSAVVRLSAIVSHYSDIDPLKLGLADSEISVKIQAAKTACYLKRSDLTSELYALTFSPVIWLRYWSMKAIWSSSRQGEKFVRTISNSQQIASQVKLEMKTKYV